MTGKPKQSLRLQAILFFSKIILISPYGFIFKTVMFKLCDDAGYTVTHNPSRVSKCPKLGQQMAEKAWLPVRWEGAAVIVWGTIKALHI